MNPSRLRGDEDALRDYAATSGGRVVVLGFERSPWVAVLKLNIPCPGDSRFPRYRYEEVQLRIEPSHDYPESEPTFVLSPVPFVPNVWTSGRVCTGEPRWTRVTALPSLVERIEKMLILDPSTSNPNSPANSDAADWYRDVVSNRRFPVPTMRLIKTTKSAAKFIFN